MLAVLGCACVAWTSFELIRLWNANQVEVRVHDDLNTARQHRSAEAPVRAGRTARFKAWDDCGHPIAVDDLGRH